MHVPQAFTTKEGLGRAPNRSAGGSLRQASPQGDRDGRNYRPASLLTMPKDAAYWRSYRARRRLSGRPVGRTRNLRRTRAFGGAAPVRHAATAPPPQPHPQPATARRHPAGERNAFTPPRPHPEPPEEPPEGSWYDDFRARVLARGPLPEPRTVPRPEPEEEDVWVPPPPKPVPRELLPAPPLGSKERPIEVEGAEVEEVEVVDVEEVP